MAAIISSARAWLLSREDVASHPLGFAPDASKSTNLHHPILMRVIKSSSLSPRAGRWSSCEEHHLSFPSLFFFPHFPWDFFPSIQWRSSYLQVLDVTPTQDAPCLPGTGVDDDGHPDGAPSSLPRHPTGECPPRAPLAPWWPRSPALIARPLPPSQTPAQINPSLATVARIEGFEVKLRLLFPLSGLFWGCGVFLESRRQKDATSGYARVGLAVGTAFEIMFTAFFLATKIKKIRANPHPGVASPPLIIQWDHPDWAPNWLRLQSRFFWGVPKGNFEFFPPKKAEQSPSPGPKKKKIKAVLYQLK